MFVYKNQSFEAMKKGMWSFYANPHLKMILMNAVLKRVLAKPLGSVLLAVCMKYHWQPNMNFWHR